MIVPMEKITMLVFHRVKEEFLSRLQGLGVVHVVVEEQTAGDETLNRMKKELERGQAFLAAARKITRSAAQAEAAESEQTRPGQNPFSHVERFERLKEETSDIEARREKLEREIANLASWGDFSLETIKKLKAGGIGTRFFIAPVKKFADLLPPDVPFAEISRDAAYVYFVVFDRGAKPLELDCDEFFYPDTDKRELESERARLKRRLEQLRGELEKTAFCRPAVREYLRQVRTGYAYLCVSKNLSWAVERKVCVVRGWVPENSKRKIEGFLEKNEIYHYFSRPLPGENVPILLANNRFARLFEPVTKLFDLPRYAEFDLTAFFAPFFTLFFGFCLSDAGYGLILLAISAAAWFKAPRRFRPLLVLGALFGVCTFFAGLISGNIFGIDPARADIFRKTAIPRMVLFSQDDLFYAALVLGAAQVIFGIFLRMIKNMRRFGFPAGLSPLGWIILLAGLIRLLLPQIVSAKPAGAWPLWAAAAGTALILLFNDTRANIFLRIGKGLWELYGITGVFGDILSYIRLFALGISTSILGMVVNEIGWGFRSIPYFGYIVSFLFLTAGHIGNFMLGALSGFVHPLRLTFVEFYKSAGFEGGGRPYEPFKRVNA